MRLRLIFKVGIRVKVKVNVKVKVEVIVMVPELSTVEFLLVFTSQDNMLYTYLINSKPNPTC